jgi:hypothetical protein
MINLTAQYPNQVFLAPAATSLIAQINTINSTGIINKDFPKKIRRANIGTAPDGSGSPTSQVDVLIGPNTQYCFQTLNDARTYALQGANQMVNNANYYVENVAPGYYQAVVWGPA